MLKNLEDIILLARNRKESPVSGSYTNQLLNDKSLSKAKILEEINRENEKIIKEGYKPFKIGIGINKGKAVSGNIGSEQQMNYTVIGDTINLGARLCSHAKSGEILISSSVKGVISDV